MADEHAPRNARGKRQLRHFSGRRIAVAIVSFGAVIAAGTYAYDLGFRQGTRHAPPLITADTSPTKARPKSPGGVEIPHQDKLVYRRLATAREPVAAAMTATLLPLPEEPLPKPPPEAVPQVVSAATVLSNAAPVDVKVSTPPEDSATRTKPKEAIEDGEPESLDAKKLVAATDVPRQTATVDAAERAKVPTPISKPRASPVSVRYRVQVGAFRTADAAAAGWQGILRRHRGLLEQLPHRVAEVDLGAGKGNYHRLQVGAYNSRAGANRLCRNLKMAGQDCLVVKY